MADKPYTTKDIEENIQTMKDEKLDLTAPIEVTIKGDDGVYEIESLGHFHVIPNMTISLKLKNYTPTTGDYALSLRNFLSLYNFREIIADEQDTGVIRIYVEFPTKYIEFGVNEWGYPDGKEDIIDTIIKKDILDRNVRSFNYDSKHDVFCVFLEESE